MTLDTSSQDSLSFISEKLDLSLDELGYLFLVSSDAVADWLIDGVPPGSATRVELVHQTVVSLLEHIKEDRLGVVVRRNAASLRGSSLLGVMRDNPAGAKAMLSAMFARSSPSK
jgi:hypothetical protein